MQIKDTKRKCALEEERRAAKARIRYQAEKQNAIDETKQQMLAEREAKIEKALEKVRIELREEARIDKEKTVAFELKQASVCFKSFISHPLDFLGTFLSFLMSWIVLSILEKRNI